MTECIDIEELEQILRLGLASTPAESQAHLQSCEACRQKLQATNRRLSLLEELRAVVRDMDVTMRPRGESEPRSVEADSMIGECIGSYRLTRVLGVGGFGWVFLAVQNAPVRRHVALKIIRPGMDTAEVVRRFRAERQALAQLDHPCIAKMFEAGSTEQGRPYFVMEFVNGHRITDYCDHRGLCIAERLPLFIQLCHAIDYAHQNRILHRDLKPSNVLVSQATNAPLPKVIDFGIAKAVGHRLIETTLETVAGQMMGTPIYMSPEQITGLTDLDRRTDIYSLGALLYQLLTGEPPFAPQRLGAMSDYEKRRTICEEEPPPPSVRVRMMDAASARDDRWESLEDQELLAEELKGNLDAIVMRAMAKNREDRYPSAATLAEETARHLEGHHVIATGIRPPRADAPVGFIRRHAIAIAMIGTALAVLVIVRFMLQNEMRWWPWNAAPKQAAPPAVNPPSNPRPKLTREDLRKRLGLPAPADTLPDERPATKRPGDRYSRPQRQSREHEQDRSSGKSRADDA